MAKRVMDVSLAFLGLVMLSPLLSLVALAIRLDSPGPVFFRQERVGRHGQIFRIHKFRTMVVDADRKGLLISVKEDGRVTRAGRWLRRYKLDELPQLIDVLLGHMSLVGPRPEVPRYVLCYPPEVRKVVLSVRPGITDLASIEYRQEAEMLTDASDPETEYIQRILPVKLSHYEQYVRTRSFLGDMVIIARTVRVVFFGKD
ncbi:MAG: sugar transferase [Nitrospirae bacterium]|nr:sugar transferase [Nitrospirota bacterium]